MPPMVILPVLDSVSDRKSAVVQEFTDDGRGEQTGEVAFGFVSFIIIDADIMGTVNILTNPIRARARTPK